MAPRLLPESRAQRGAPLDRAGIALLTLGAVAVLLPLVEGRERGWPAWSWASLALGIAILPALVAHQRRLGRRGGTPLLDPALFAVRAFRAGLGTQLTYWCTQASFYLVLALYLQEGRGLDALQAGLIFTILAAAYVPTSLRAPALALRHGRAVIAVGALTLLAGYAALLAAAGGPLALLAPGLALAGVGQGLCITPLTMTVLAHADAQRAGAVSGALSTMQQAGNALGVALTGIVFFGALDGGYTHAFDLALLELGALLVVVVALTRLLPRP
jgi:predicted MFS family arabinose efflux permease